MERLENYDQLYQDALKTAAEARTKLDIQVSAILGNPIFDALPEILRRTPQDVDVRINLIFQAGFTQDTTVKLLADKLVIQVETRINTQVRASTESQLTDYVSGGSITAT